jgi:hypothetical protein
MSRQYILIRLESDFRLEIGDGADLRGDADAARVQLLRDCGDEFGVAMAVT